jgi:3',5'-cyclic AMP phosphodiesterase CpdA
MTYRFLHISDIHFGQEKNGKLVKHESVRDALVSDAKSLAKSRGVPDRILITGDISYSGKLEEYTTATEWIEELAAACGCDETHVSTIPGNHDCDLGAISNQAKMIYAQFRVSTPEQVQANLDGIGQDGEAANPFLPKLQAYRDFARGYGCDFESPSRPLWVRDFDFPGGIKLRLLGLTSVQVSDLGDKLGNIVLGNQQYTIADEENIINVVLVHHPLNWFIDAREATQYIHNNARVIMVGHEHTLNIEKTIDAFTRKERLAIYAGAANPPERDYSYTYNWLEFSCEEIKGRQHLVIRVFPRVWIQERVRFDADRTRLGGSGESASIEIFCDNLHPVSEKQAVAAAEPASAIVMTKRAEGKSMNATSTEKPLAEPKDRSTMSTMNTESPGFDRLRYLFWRYLDWRQRLKVLVDIDALPKTADRPLPQTLERLALEAVAKQEGKLHELWEAMMPFIPPDKRGTNPFPWKEK